MACCCCITVLLLLLLVAAQELVEAQSGDGDGDTETEPRISCTSDLMASGSSLTCKLVGGHNDNEDDEDDDDIMNMTVCFSDWSNRPECKQDASDTVRNLDPLVKHIVTVHLKTGGTITSQIDLKKIVKPRSPQVSNVTFNLESNQAVFHIQIPYHNEILKEDNQLFQLQIWTAGSSTVQNTSSVTLEINMEHLRRNTKYHVEVRAIPQDFLQGTWSEWSKPFSFFTPADTETERVEIYTLPVCLVLLVVVTSSVVFFWKNKIFTYMWPNVPHPKHTLVQICKPNRGLLLNFKPEVFSALKVCPMEKPEEQSHEDMNPSTSAAEGSQSDHPCSTQSSDCRSSTRVSSEELTALLSRSSSDGDDSLQASSPSPTDAPQPEERPHTPEAERSGGGNEAEVFGVGQQEEAYVTMSSFYQIK